MRLAIAATLILAASPALAAQYGCDGIFAKDTTLAAIEAQFGKQNVISGEVPGVEGEMFRATTIYPGDPDREMQVRWWDEASLTGFAGVTLAAADSGPSGIKIGMPIGEVEAINGEPFDLMGFFWDYGGSAGFQTGTLSRIPGGCVLNLQFSPTTDELPEDLSLAISGDVPLRSNQPEMAAAKVAVDRINLNYPYPQPSLASLPPDEIASLVDATSFDNSIGPRRQEGLRTFADYGFTTIELVDGTAELYEDDRSWMFAIRVLEAGDDDAILCITDKALGGPTYNAQSAIPFVRNADGLLVASGDEDVVAEGCAARP